jgi:hypothetical protein
VNALAGILFGILATQAIRLVETRLARWRDA